MSRNFKLRHLTLAVGIALGSQPVLAAEEGEAVADENIEQIVVVGTRSAPRSVADSPVPVDVVSGDELSKSGASDLLDALQSAVPSFNVRAQPISDAATLIRPVNLRGLSSDSTLILVNGKRRHRASVIAFQGGGVNDGAQGPDISVIPSVALKQVEVLRDGASAQYGSDAIAGVMNFILRDDRDGGSISVKYGEFSEGDGETTVVDGNIGLPFTDNGFANFSFQLKNVDPTSRSVQRPDAANLIDQGNTDVNDPAQIWGNPEVEDDITIFGNIGLDLEDDKEAYLFGNYSERDVTGGFYYRNPHNRGNVFSIDGGQTLLVGDVAQSEGAARSCAVVNIPKNPDGSDGNVLTSPEYLAMLADPNCFSMNSIMPGGYTPQFGGNITDTSITGGVRGDINAGLMKEWSFDLSASVGRNESEFFLKNTLNPSLGLSTPTNFQTGKYIQLEKTFNLDLVRGFDIGLAEDLNFAFGAEWREESFEIVSGEESSWKAGPYADQGFNIGSHGFKGFGPESQGRNERRNWAFYADVETYFTEGWMVGAAVRYEDFNTFGDTTDYKVTTQFEITDNLSIRASHSTGFRAPTVGQENVVNTQTSLVEGELIQSFLAPPTDPLSAFYGGKVLQPEESTSYAAGIVYQNGDFFLTVDAYSIEVTDRLAQSSQIDVLEEDWDDLRDLGVKNPELISAVTYFNNDFDTTTEGVDVVANYSMGLLGGDTKFSLAYNFNDTTVDKFNPETTSEGKVERLEDGIPDHQATFTVSQSWDAFGAFLRFNYFGEYYAVHADDTSDGWSETADSTFTLDGEVSWYATDSLTFTVGGNNLLDEEAQELQKGPDGAYSIVGGKYYESGPFDYNGAFYYGKVTYKF
ncbi:TonB-dependent receptor [Thalassotalea sp. Y01]|uniref:TonB-dependent receptor plug domain-containing protein n=1 Tax=Thalassotalea sp. Y01 TaxID=2729613 RepID=UPI00145DDC4C|nr:TonB-dependent receptor [Thalassotalea sp. Y01]NMP15243.1 TonB-dependent receptor [Thalassotalea sp. Y01]